MLTRTDAMMKAYINNIRIDNGEKVVGLTMSYPDDEIGKRARAHQGDTGQPKGVNGPRPFDVEKFKEIAFKHAQAAMKKANR